MNKNVTPITESKVIVIGAKIKGFGSQTVEIRNYAHDLHTEHETDPFRIMIMVNGQDMDVAYIKAGDLMDALTMLGVVS